VSTARTELLEKSRDVVDAGATAVEYALMVVLIAAVIVGAVTALGLATAGLFTIPGL
jgi:Flp pilus assembly pilin Flp